MSITRASGFQSRTHAVPQRTDSRPLAERKQSVALRIGELREALRQAEAADAELATLIEADERAREQERAAHRSEGRYASVK